jgi:hypothetical protein
MKVFTNDVSIELTKEEKDSLNKAFFIVKDIRDTMRSDAIARMSNVYDSDSIDNFNYEEFESAVHLLNSLSYYDKISLLREKE